MMRSGAIMSSRTLRTIRIRPLHSSSLLLRQAVYDFNKIKDITQSKSSSKPVLLDVREPDEFTSGSIPTSQNLPLSSLEQDLALSPKEFESKFGFKKPGKEEEVVFYCKAGVRSTNASNIAEKLGYNQIGNYKGSYLDWTSQTSSPSDQPPNPNQTSGHGDGAPGGIDLKAMNQKEESRAEGRKQEEKKGNVKLDKAGGAESESVKSGAEMSDTGKFQ